MTSEPEIEIIDLDAHEPPRLNPRRFFILLAVLFLGFVFLHNGVPLYIDALWFKETGYTRVFTTQIIAKTSLFFGMGALCFALLYGNIALARRMASDETNALLMQRFGAEWGLSAQRYLGRLLFVVTAFVSLWAGRLAANQWAEFLAYKNAVPFHTQDPVFHNDISFYVFHLPFLEYLYEFALSTLLISAIAVLAVHIASRAIESFAGLASVKPKVFVHLLSLAVALALLQAWGTRLSLYELLLKDNGVFHGAGYADLTYRLFARNTQIFLLLATALLCLLTLWKRPLLRWAIAGAGLWLVAMVLLGAVAPQTLQKVIVEPNQFAMEQENIKRNIAYTRQGFGLEKVRRVENFPADETLNATLLQKHKTTLANIRLWDYNYLGKVYSQNQTVKTYYKFEQSYLEGGRPYNIDIDRYRLQGRLQQVMLAAREMDPTSLPRSAQTWQNLRLGYTHGYGVVMSPVSKASEGLPSYFLQGIPPLSSMPNEAALKIERPEIYYGMLNPGYVCVDTEQQEFDYPATDGGQGSSGSQDHYASYAGKGGIAIGDAPLAKLAFSLLLGDANLLLSKNLKPSSRLLYRREVRERVHTIAPFLQLDSDPYIVLANGRQVWMLDAYTVSDRYPYSTPVSVQTTPYSSFAPNYIRNSVKATVDAYDGTMNLYLTDPNDPVAQTYNRAFGNILKPLSEMPAELRSHMRYPEDLFRLQRSVYAAYHVEDPRVFYLKEDAWAVPSEPNAESSAEEGAQRPAVRQMEPYYVVMRLPEQRDEEFLLISPMAPINREDKNMLGWMCARCDGENYGELTLYRFPQQASVNGPTQIISLINSDPIISSQLSLLRQGGSNASIGNLIVIPLEKSLLYIAPLYIEAASAAKLPQLQKVLVVFGQKAVMENTLEAALARMFPGYGGAVPPSEPNGSPTKPSQPAGSLVAPPALRALIDKANTQYENAQQKLRGGDFAAYGAAVRELESTLQEMKRLTSAPPRP